MKIKSRWETEGNISISQEKWSEILKQQWKTTNSPIWKEFSWKNIIRYFCTPYQKKAYSNQSGCWRCGSEEANHYHIFWSCPDIASFWLCIQQVLETVFSRKIAVCFRILYLVDLDDMEWSNKDKYLLRILLVACKKSITKKWLKKQSPSVNDWIDIIHSIFIMERITYNIRTQKEVFIENWQKWITYISTTRPDFR